MKKVLILTSYTREIEWENYGRCDYGELASTNHKEYADFHGYSFHAEIIDPKDYKGIHLTWVKIYSVYKFIEFYDYVVWIDADAIFTNYKMSIDEILGDPDPNLVLTKAEWDRENQKLFTGISTGFMVFKNSIWSKKILLEMISYDGDLKKNYGFHEQTYMSDLIMSLYLEENPEESTIWYKSKKDIEIPIFLKNPKIKILPYEYQRIYDEFNSPYIYHAGGSTPTKKERIEKALIEKNNMINVNYNYEDGVFVELGGFDELKRGFDIKLINTECNKIINEWNIGINHWVKSGIKYYIPWKIQILDFSRKNVLWENYLDLSGESVYINIEFNKYEDVIKSIPALNEFSRKHKCKIYFTCPFNIPKKNWGDSILLESGNIDKNKYKACYDVGLYLNSENELLPQKHKELYTPHWDILGISRDILGITQ